MDLPLLDSEILRLVAPGALAVWAGGSRVEQLGNVGSDIDYYACVDSLGEFPVAKMLPNGSAIVVQYVDSLRVDIEVWPNLTIIELAERFASTDFDSVSINTLDALTEYECDFVHRLINGKVISGAKRFESLCALFPSRRLVLYLMRNMTIYLDDAVEDVAGMLASGHWRNASLRARDAIGFAADVLLCSYGDTNNRSKYRWPRLLRLTEVCPELSAWIDQWWKLESHLPSAEFEALLYCLDALAMCEVAIRGAEKSHAGL